MKKLARVLAASLVLTYLSVLVMSAGHLYEWYRLFLGDLPRFFAIGLAASLELAAFLLSLTSNLLPSASKWATPGAAFALSVVWAGNLLSMRRAAENLAMWEVVLASTFVPIGTLVVAKVVGELIRYTQGEGKQAPQTGEAEEAAPEERRPEPALEDEQTRKILSLLPDTIENLGAKLGLPRAALIRTLSRLAQEGRVSFDGERWKPAN